MAPEYLDSVLEDALGKSQVAFLGGNGCVGDGLVGFLNGFDQIFSGCVHFRVSHAVVPFLATLCDKHRSRCILLASICILHLYAENVKSQRQGIGHKRVTNTYPRSKGAKPQMLQLTKREPQVSQPEALSLL